MISAEHLSKRIDQYLNKSGTNDQFKISLPDKVRAIKKKNILIKGSPTQVIRYGVRFELYIDDQGKLYYLADEDAKGEFVAEPHNFANPNTAHVTPPPLRIAVIGPAGSGKVGILFKIDCLVKLL